MPWRLPRLVFRADISRRQWRRDSLDGLLDDHVVGSAMRRYSRLVFERKRALGEIVLEYGSTNPIEGSNVQPVAWCLDVWSMGADGVVPWQTVGNAESWARADELSLFYPSRGVGPHAEPIPSIRLKAYRRGQQDVEYLTLWSQVRNEPRWAVGQQVRAALKLAGTRQGTGFTGGDDAGRIDYGRLRPRDVWAMRVAIGEALSQAHPAPGASSSTSARRAANQSDCARYLSGRTAHPKNERRRSQRPAFESVRAAIASTSAPAALAMRRAIPRKISQCMGYRMYQ